MVVVTECYMERRYDVILGLGGFCCGAATVRARVGVGLLISYYRRKNCKSLADIIRCHDIICD